jgi:hypothetical protein
MIGATGLIHALLEALFTSLSNIICPTFLECNFSKRRNMSTLEVKVGDHIIPQVTRFKYLGFIVQNDGEIEADVSHRIQSWVVEMEKSLRCYVR